MPRGTASGAASVPARPSRGERVRCDQARMRDHARTANSTASAASAANGLADAETGNPRAACPSSTAMYQRSGRMRAPGLRERVHAEDGKADAGVAECGRDDEAR